MALQPWLEQNWFALVQTAGIIGGLVFAALAFRLDARTRRVSNLLLVTEQHRHLWSQLFDRPALGRVLRADVNLRQNPVTPDEELFVMLLVVHLGSAWRTMDDGLLSRLQGLRNDVAAFFSLPVPKAVWDQLRPFQDDDFASFVEQCLAGPRLR